MSITGIEELAGLCNRTDSFFQSLNNNTKTATEMYLWFSHYICAVTCVFRALIPKVKALGSY